MAQVYVLHHVRADDEYGDDAKMIGVYRSADAAKAAIARLGGQPGFRDHPAGFQIDAYHLDEDHWAEGFVTVGIGEFMTWIATPGPDFCPQLSRPSQPLVGIVTRAT